MSDKRRKILVIRQDRLGDAINTIPVLITLRKNISDVFISFMVAPQLVELFKGQPYVDEVVSWDKNICCLFDVLRMGRYNSLLMLHPSKTLAWAAFFAGVRNKSGLGFKPYYPLTGFKASHLGRSSSATPGFDTACGHSALGGVYRDAGLFAHESQFNLAVAHSLFDLPEGIEPPRIFLSAKEMSEAKNILMSMNVHNPIAILPANRGSSANWPPERWADLVRKLVETKQEVIIIGGPGEEKILEQAKGGMNVPIIGPDMSLRRLAAIFASCRQVVGSSTGPLHLAAAVGAQTVGLFCPAPASRPERWRPLGEGHMQLTQRSGCCEACLSNFKCVLSGITVEEVFNAVNK
jgi:ADP-heptose:LPS heptosyltransferase